MGVVTIEREIAFAVPQTIIFKHFVNETPQMAVPIFSCDVLKENGVTQKKASFAVPGNELKYVKIKDAVTNKHNFSHSYTIVEGDPWEDTLEKINVEMKVEATPNGGCVVKYKRKYIPKPNCTLDKARIHEITESLMALCKLIEAQLLANPASGN